MQTSFFAVLLQFILIKIVSSHYSIGSAIKLSQMPINAIQPEKLILRSLLSTFNQAQIPERIEIISSALQQMPVKKNKVFLAELLKDSALQSLAVAADACKRAGILPVEYGLPVSQNNVLPIGSVPALEYGLPVQINNALPVASAKAVEYGLPVPRNNGLPVASVPTLPSQEAMYFSSDYTPRRTVKIQYF